MASRDWARFAPSLSHLAATIEEFEPVICGWSSGPQPQAAGYDPAEPEHLSIDVDTPWQDPSPWIHITAEGCYWWDDDGRWECSHGDLWAFLSQIPRRLHTFGRQTEE
jgi:hypothetical protein